MTFMGYSFIALSDESIAVPSRLAGSRIPSLAEDRSWRPQSSKYLQLIHHHTIAEEHLSAECVNRRYRQGGFV
jgi:hypothetical protein